jgi:hypothetical protein
VTEHNVDVIDKAELRRMSPAERRQLARDLADLDGSAYRGSAYEGSAFDSSAYDGTNDSAGGGAGAGREAPPVDPVLRRERRLALQMLTACCVILAGWIVVLGLTLPRHFDAHHWRATWVLFDVILLAVFMAIGWAARRERQALIPLLMIIGTMLCCDAWFDVWTSMRTSSFPMSLASAAFAELPLAFIAFAGARRLLIATIRSGPLAPPARQGDRTRYPSRLLRNTSLADDGVIGALPRPRSRKKPPFMS